MLEIGIIILIVSLLFLLFFLDWNGIQRGIVLLFFLLLAKLYKKGKKSLIRNNYLDKTLSLFIILVIILNILFIRWFFYDFNKEEFLYEGKSTVNAANNFFKLHLNPYEVKTDQDVDVKEFAGYKYMPLMFFIYAPLSIPLGKTGIFVTNLIFYIGTLIVALFLIKKIYNSRYVNKKYLFFFLACYILTFELFYQGVNDIIPVFFILCSILFFLEDKKILSGLFLGLSISTKIFPGIFLFIMFLLGKQFKKVLSSLAVILVIIIPFLLWNVLAFFVNTIYFNIIRLPNRSSIFFFYALFYTENLDICADSNFRISIL